MKNINPVKTLICLALFGLAIACKKTNTITLPLSASCFTVQVKPAYGNYFQIADAAYIDTNFYFRNCSDSGDLITYQWNFGDGVTSTDKNPVHHYSNRGKYTVILEVYNNNMLTDTVQKTVTAISGQQNISFGDGKITRPVAIDETASGDFLVLGATGYDAPGYLMTLDSLLKLKRTDYLPATYRFNSMKPTSDGNYIFTGTTSAFTRYNELVKLKPDGSYLWNRISSSSDDSYINVVPASDGGYIVVASQPAGNVPNYAKVKRFDGNGTVQWERTLITEGMLNAKEVVQEQDGIVVAGLKRSTTCYDCDSVMIAKLNNTGGLVWQNTVFGGLNYTLGSMRIIKHPNGSYLVATEGNRGIFVFSPSGAFLDRKLARNSITAIANAGDGNVAVLQTEGSNGFRAAVSKMTLDGAELWYMVPDGTQKTATGSRCCSSSWPISVQPFRNGGILMMSDKIDETDTYRQYDVTTLLPLTDAGKLK